MDATATISLIAISLSLATFITIRLNRAENENLRQRLANHRRLAELQFGDVARVPQELRPARKNAEGGSSGQGGRADDAQHGSHFHVGTGK
jgi:hypothetical protein